MLSVCSQPGIQSGPLNASVKSYHCSTLLKSTSVALTLRGPCDPSPITGVSSPDCSRACLHPSHSGALAVAHTSRHAHPQASCTGWPCISDALSKIATGLPLWLLGSLLNCDFLSKVSSDLPIDRWKLTVFSQIHGPQRRRLNSRTKDSLSHSELCVVDILLKQ